MVYRSVRVGVELSRKRIAPALIAYFLENDSTEIFYNDAISIPSLIHRNSHILENSILQHFSNGDKISKNSLPKN